MTHENGIAKPAEDAEATTQMVAPEGGWGYVICFGLAAMFVICTAHQPSLGMIYNDFLIEIGEGTSGMTLVLGIFGMTLAISGFLTNLSLKRFSLRQAGLFGATIYFIGTFATIFVQSISHMILTVGILQGFGFGIMIPVVYTNFNLYFTKKRVLLLSLCKAGIGLMSMLYPFIINYTMQKYGFRGTLLILCGISAHIFLAIIVLQPVEWHMIKVTIPMDAKKETIKVIITSESSTKLEDMSESDNRAKQTAIEEATVANPEEESKTDEPLLVKQIIQQKARSTLSVNNITVDPPNPDSPIEQKKETRSRSITLDLLRSEIRRNSLQIAQGTQIDELAYIETVYRATSISSLSNMANVPVEPLPPIKYGKQKWRVAIDMLDLGLLKDPVYCSIILGTGLGFFSDLTFFILQPLYLYTIGFTAHQIATVISVGAGTDLFARIAMAVLGNYITPKGRSIFLFGAVSGTILRTIFLFFTDFIGVTILTAINGLFRCCVQIPLALNVAEHVPIKRFPAAYGLFMLAYGFINLIAGPIIGILRDLTQSYIAALLALNLCNICFIIPWVIEMVYMARKSKKTEELKES